MEIQTLQYFRTWFFPIQLSNIHFNLILSRYLLGALFISSYSHIYLSELFHFISISISTKIKILLPFSFSQFRHRNFRRNLTFWKTRRDERKEVEWKYTNEYGKWGEQKKRERNFEVWNEWAQVWTEAEMELELRGNDWE